MAEFELFSYNGAVWARWEKKAEAVKYIVLIKENDDIVCIRQFASHGLRFPVRIMDSGQGKDYEGELQIVSEWQSAFCQTADDKQLLKVLLERLEKEKKGNVYCVPETMEFPGYTSGTSFVFARLAALWKIRSLCLESLLGAVITEEETGVVLEGVCPDLPFTKKIKMFFQLTEELTVDLQITVFMADAWIWSHLFPALEGHIFDRLPFREVSMTLKQEECVLEGILCCDTDEAHTVRIAWRSGIDFAHGEPAFSLEEVAPLRDSGWETIRIQEPGRGELVLRPWKLQIYRRFLKEEWVEQAAVQCGYAQDGREIPCILFLPCQLDPACDDGAGVALRMSEPDALSCGVREVLARAGSREFVSYLPEFFAGLVCSRIECYEIVLEGWHLRNSSRKLEISLPDVELIPSLISLRKVAMSLEVHSHTLLEEVRYYYKWKVLAAIELRTCRMRAEIEVTENKAWSMLLKPEESQDFLTAAGELFGFDVQKLFQAFPEELAGLFRMGIQELKVKFFPFEQSIESVQFVVGQCADWNILPDRFCLCGWTARIRLRCAKTNADWKVSARIEGALRLGDPAKKQVVQVSILLQEDMSAFSIRMKEGGLSFPTVQEGLELLGMGEGARRLPDAIASMKGPFIEDFEIGVERKETFRLRNLYVSFRTQEPLELISDSLILHSVSARIAYRLESGTLGVTITGEIRICGVGVRVKLSNQNPEGEWKLSVLSLCAVPIPGIGQMAQWLCPEEFLTYIPDTFMPFRNGLNLYHFGFDYHFTKKEISRLEFGISNCDPWRILDGLLVLDRAYVEGKLQSVSAGRMSSVFLVQSVWKLGTNKLFLELTAGSESGGKDTVLKGTLSREETEAVSLDGIQEKGIEPLQSLPLPSDFQIPYLESLEAQINLTKKHYIVCGEMEHLGTAGFAVIKSEKHPETAREEEATYDWQYAVAFQLKKNFSFRSLIPALEVLDHHLHIEQAGFVLASFSSASLSRTIEGIAEWKNLLPSGGLGGISLKKGLLLYGKIRIAGSRFQNILQLGDDLEPSLAIAVFSYLDREAEQSKIQGSMSSFSLLKLFHFQEIMFCYVPAQGNLFHLSGTISVTIGGTEYAFTGDMQLNDSRGNFEVHTAHEIVRPLGIPGITIRQLILAVDCRFETEEHPQKELTVAVKGSVGFGKKDGAGQEEIILDACLLYDKQDFQIVEVSLAKPLSVDRLFAAVFSSVRWPKGLLDITFSDGILYYARQECVIADQFYQQGFHLNTNISVYGVAFGVEVDVYDDGISVSGYAQKPVSLLFAKLTDAREEQKGPSVYIRTCGGENRFGLQGGITLFGERFCSVPAIEYNITKKVFCGTMSYNGSIEWLHGSISFEWNEQDGFCITSWPMKWVTDALDYAKMIEKASRIPGSECEALVDLVWSETIFTKCSVEPKFGRSLEEGMLPLELTVTYEVMVKKKTIITTRLPAISIGLPILENFSFQGLSDALQKVISKNAFRVFEQIFADSDKLAEFIAVIGITKYGSKAAASLICNGLKEWMSGSKSISAADSLVKKTAGHAAEGGAGLADAAASAAAAAEASEKASEVFASIAAFFATLAGIFSSGSSDSREAQEKKEAARKEKEKADRQLEQVRSIIRGMLQIKEMTYVICPDKNTVSVQFQKIAPDHTGVVYEIEVFDDNGGKVFEKSISDSEPSVCTVPYEVTEGKQTGKLRVQLKAVYTDVSSKKQYRYEGDVFTKGILCYERFAVQVQYQEERLAALWNPVSGAENYELSLRTEEKEIKRYNGLRESGITIDLLYETFSVASDCDLYLHVEVHTEASADIQSFITKVNIPTEDGRLSSLRNRLKKESVDLLWAGRYIRRQFPDVGAVNMARLFKEIDPEMSAEIMSDMIYLLYGNLSDEILTAAYAYKIQGLDAMQSAKKLKETYPNITAEKMADVLMKVFA